MTVSNRHAFRKSFLVRQGRNVIIVGVAQFVVSNALLFLAATSYWQEPPRWTQILDVFLVFSIVITAGCIYHAAGRTIEFHIWHQSYRIANFLPVVVLLVLWLGQRQFNFDFLTGVAWRLWLVSFILPATVTLWRLSGAITAR